MLHTKFQGQLVLRKKIFFKDFYHYGHGGHIGHVTLRFVQIFIPSTQGGSKRNLVTFGPVPFEEMFETVIP